MTKLRSLSVAMLRSFVRDRAALFFTVIFPLMFLVLFGAIFTNTGAPKSNVVQVGAAPILDQLPPGARTQLDDVLEITKSDDLDAAVQQVRDGDITAAVEQHGNQLVVHYSAADQVQAATVQGTLQSLVQGANVAVTGRPPTFSLSTERVEDESLEQIQFVTPGLLGWAIATGATFGAAMTLVGWRERKLLRRLRLAPVSTGSLVGARVLTSLLVALVQTAIFLGLAVGAFGLRLSGSWWLSVPLIVCGTLAFLSIGLLAGAVAKTSEGASSISNLIVLPMAFLSGSFFPIDEAPGWITAVAQVLPLRHLNEGMLDVMVRDQGWAGALAPMGILLGFAAVVGFLAVRLFRWEAD